MKIYNANKFQYLYLPKYKNKIELKLNYRMISPNEQFPCLRVKKNGILSCDVIFLHSKN